MEKTTDLPQVTDKINVVSSTSGRDRYSKWGDKTIVKIMAMTKFSFNLAEIVT